MRTAGGSIARLSPALAARGRSEGIREQIQRVARQLFVQSGYDGLGVGAVARAARVSRSRVYALFPGRQALLAGVVDHDVDELVARMVPAARAQPDLDTMLTEGVSTFLDFVEERKGEYEVLFGLTGRLEPDVARLLQSLRDRLVDAYLLLFRPAVEAYGIKWPSEAEARLTAHAMMAMVEGAVQAWLAEATLPRGRLIQVLAAMIRRALVPLLAGARAEA
ncbi:MAG: TetR/AcrR family transcriptional regulator [Chloroflexi bacterium]|nr:MAG: TetR/AcrR family transcriptional regulator [Chloroflexota bacterium]